MGSLENGEIGPQMYGLEKVSGMVIGPDTFFASGWNPFVSMPQSEDFATYSLPTTTSTTHFVQNPSDSRHLEVMEKLSSFGRGSFSERIDSFALPESNHITNSEERAVDGSSPDHNRRKRSSDSPSGSNKVEERDAKKPKIDSNNGLRGKQAGKLVEEKSHSEDPSEKNYIHVRARRGQATNSHSLAERVRREKISERMRLLQELVPGCNKIIGKAVMLDEIINYVQSLQQQVEFLSMKLATVNPELNFETLQIPQKNILHTRRSNGAVVGSGPGLSSSHSHPFPLGIFELSPTMPSIPSLSQHFPSLAQNELGNVVQSLFQMGFNPGSSIDNLVANGHLKDIAISRYGQKGHSLSN